MKVVKQGRPQLPDRWWVGQVATCSICGAAGELEDTDRVRIQNRCASARCFTPNCKGYLHAAIPQEYKQP